MVGKGAEGTERRTLGGLRIIQEHVGDSPGRSGLHGEFKLRVDPGPGYHLYNPAVNQKKHERSLTWAEETARNSRGTLVAPEEQQIQSLEGE